MSRAGLPNFPFRDGRRIFQVDHLTQSNCDACRPARSTERVNALLKAMLPSLREKSERSTNDIVSKTIESSREQRKTKTSLTEKKSSPESATTQIRLER
jgi:hypothetical protein